jgi:RHS repeat-associated protein
MVYLDLLRRYAQLHELSLVDDLNPTGYSQVMDEIVGGVVQREYTYGLQRVSQYQVISNLWTPSFYVYDGAGSVRQLANAAGAVTDTYEYDAFGVTLSHTGTMPNNYMYRGEQYDADLGLYYLRARYYNSLTGRFLSRDTESGKPKDPKSLHKYLYANGDPVNRLDPKGRDSIIDYAIELGESEQSIAELRATAAAVRNALMEVCVTEQLGIMLESGLYVGLSWEALVAEATAYCEYLLF